MSMVQAPTPNFVEQLQDDPLIELEWRRGLFGKTREESARRDGGGGRYNYRLRPEQRVKNAQRIPQAVVKIIPGGGCSGRGQLTAQLNYLSRDGDLELEEGYRDFRNPIWDTDGIRDTATRWAMDWEDAMSRDGRTARAKNKTFHMLISYPEGTDPETAKEAADKFADRLCHSGEFGDEWRNVRAWHTDRTHPHMHLVIDRLGESGRMMQIHPAKPINPKRLRALQVDTAAEYGLALNDTPRVSRGHRELGLSSAEHRLEERGQRMDRSYPRLQYSMVVEGYAELSINQEVKELKALAQEYRDTAPFSKRLDAMALEEAAETLTHGGTLTGPSLRDEELDREQERDPARQHEQERELAREREKSPFLFRSMTVQEIERELMGIQDEKAPEPTPDSERREPINAIKKKPAQTFRPMSIEEIERDLMGGTDERPFTRRSERDAPDPSVWDQLDKLARWQREDERREPERDRNEPLETQMDEHHATRNYRFAIGTDIDSTAAEPKVPVEQLGREDRKPTFDEFMAQLEVQERETWENDRKLVASLLDDIEIEQIRSLEYVPNADTFFEQIDGRIDQLTKAEKKRARDLGIDDERTRDQGYGLSYGF